MEIHNARPADAKYLDVKFSYFLIASTVWGDGLSPSHSTKDLYCLPNKYFLRCIFRLCHETRLICDLFGLYTDSTQQAYQKNISVTMKTQDEYVSVGSLREKYSSSG